MKLDEINNDVLIADALIKIKAMEKLLISKNIITEEEFSNEVNILAKQVAKLILENAGISEDLEQLIGDKKESN